MLDVKVEIKSWLLKGILLGIGALLVLLSKEILYCIYALSPIIPIDTLNKVPRTTLLYISSLSALLNLITIAYLFYLLFFNKNLENNQLISQYGIKFDYAYRPLCPVCDSPLQVEKIPLSVQLKTKPKLFCPKDVKHYDRVPTDLIGEEKHISVIVSDLFKKPPTIFNKIFKIKA